MRLSISARWIGILGLALTLATGFFNHGIIALDDYSEGFSKFVPAQHISFSDNLASAGIRLPFQSIFLLALSKTALWLGLNSPTQQIQFVLLLLGALTYLTVFFCVKNIFKNRKDQDLALGLTSFYFILPLVYSRPLIENLSSSWVMLSALFAFKFLEKKQLSSIFLSIVFISLAALFRFQSGVCVLAWIPILFLHRTRKSVGIFILSSAFAFVFTGLLDLLLTGGFHRSLKAYVDYNLQYASGYGTTPFYTFILLFLGLSLPPAFIGRYREFNWKKSYQGLLAPLLYFGVFVLAHSLIPHKEERFMIPVLPLFLILLTPLAHYWIFEAKSRWRVAYFCSLNFLLLPLACFSTPQNNVISLVRYLDKHPEISTVINYGPSVILFPEAFSLRRFEVLPVKAPPFSVAIEYSGKPDCNSVHVANEVFYRQDLSTMKVLETFSPGPLEALLVKLNPRQNARRGRIFLLKDKNCD